MTSFHKKLLIHILKIKS